jgi:hypothetical protein
MANSCLLALIFGALESEGPQEFGRKAKDMPMIAHPRPSRSGMEEVFASIEKELQSQSWQAPSCCELCYELRSTNGINKFDSRIHMG